jgi:hypothetical protein
VREMGGYRPYATTGTGQRGGVRGRCKGRAASRRVGGVRGRCPSGRVAGAGMHGSAA